MKEDYTGSRENRDEIVVTRTATDDPSCSSGYRYDLEVWWDALGFYMTIASYESAGAAMRGYDALWNASQILPEREVEERSEEDTKALAEAWQEATR